MLAAAVLSAGIMSAQDLNAALELANQGNDAFTAGSPELALEAFQQSLKIAEGLGEEGANHVETCKTAICNIYMSLAKNTYKEKNWDAAVEAFTKAKEVAEGYGETEIAEEAAELVNQANALKFNTEGKAAMKAKDFPTAISCFTKVLELDPTNGATAVQLGQAYMNAGQLDEAITALETAMANGQEKNATKLLAQLYLKRCQESLKASKLQEALDFANKSNEYAPSANAYKLGANAATKMNKLNVAEEMYLKYLELSPNAKDASDIKVTLAESFRKAGNKAKAKEYFQMLVNDPKYGATAKQMLPTL